MGKTALFGIALGVLALGLGTAGFYLEFEKVSDPLTIELREGGFFPELLEVNKGDTVWFVTQRSSPFWPASNLHPTHELYPEFDPQRALGPDESWSFTFEEEGVWLFHDHINPFFTGRIIVRAQEDLGFLDAQDLDCSDIESLPENDKERCWNMLLSASLAEGGAEQAMATFRELYQTYPSFAFRGCHWFAHRVGEEVYGNFRYSDSVEFPAEATYCSYGFVHGFLEHKFRDEQNADSAKAFCDQLSREYENTLPRIRLNCFHTIGHGFTDDPPPVELWGNPQGIVEKPLRVCEGISEEPEEVKECYDGAYNTLVNFMAWNQYGLFFSQEDPLGFCETQEHKHQESCYYEFSQLLDSAGNRDLETIALFVRDIEDPQIADMIINTASAGLMQQAAVAGDLDEYAGSCQAMEERFRLSCVRGMVGGLMAHGEPGAEYEKAIAFCESPSLASSPRDACHENLFLKIRDTYPRQKAESVCSALSDPRNGQCLSVIANQ